VNVEVDVVARYLERLVPAARGGAGLSLQTLAASGFRE
jgi:hypothetical protein